MHIGNPDEITIKAFGEEVLELVGNPKAKLIYKDLPKDDPKQRKPHIEKAQKILGWNPTVDRAEGMKRTYEYFKTVVKVPETV